MGLEANVVAVKKRQEFQGKLHIDSRALEFRSRDLKLRIPLDANLKVSGKDQQLKVVYGGESITFGQLEKVERWVDKILNPPDLAKKLGLASDVRCWLSKGFRKSFHQEIRAAGARITKSVSSCDLAFYWIPRRELLPELVRCCEDLPESTSLWTVYPKGSKSVSQGEIMSTLKEISFGPSKTASIDDETSSMRYRRKKA